MKAPATSTLPPDGHLAALLAASGLAPLRLAGRTLLPLVQGGMGVGVSAHRLAGAVAAEGGVGTISSVDLRRHHPDLMERTTGLEPGEAAKQAIDEANLEAISREVGAAREIAGGRGLLAINVMRAVSAYAASVKRALEAGIDAVVVGAGLPLDLPDLAQDHPKAALIPILSDARGVQLIVKKWERKKRLPDAIVIEHPRLAGGHLGAARIADLNDPRFEFENVIPQSLAFLRSAGIEREIPLIAAGGIRSCEDIARVQALGAAAVQLGTPFAVTSEGDAHAEFKRVLAKARDGEMVQFTSVAGLPARAVATPWLRSYLAAEDRLQAVFQYQFAGATESEGIRANSRYMNSLHSPGVDVNSGRGDELHTLYAGLNYHICGDNLKIMGGVEYANLDTPAGDVDAVTLLIAFRTFF